MKNLRTLGIVLMALILSLCLGASVFAAEDTGFSDVADDAWYAEAVAYCRDQGIMSGVTETTFAPGSTMTRAMLASVLYQIEGSPAVTGDDAFTDTQSGAWYAPAVLWASQEGMITGYGGNRFGTNDPVTRQQIATILWKYAGSPTVETGAAFADETAISSWAAAAVDWARSEGLVSGKAGNRFDPAGNATRAEVAAILQNLLQGEQSETPTEEGARVLVAYFSATGNTETIAAHIAEAVDGQLYEIVPAQPYTSADLNYNDSGSRVSTENGDSSIRPAISGSVADMGDYDVVFLGYPIWWGHAPNIVSTFLESYDFADKTIIPFCTSSSSGIGSSGSNLHSLAEDALWLDGARFAAGASQSSVSQWATELMMTIKE